MSYEEKADFTVLAEGPIIDRPIDQVMSHLKDEYIQGAHLEKCQHSSASESC